MLQRLFLHLLTATVAVASLGLGSPWLGTAAADAAQVTVVTASGKQVPLALSSLAGREDVNNRAYTLHSGTSTTTQSVTGFSLEAIIDAASANKYTFDYLEIQRPDGGASIRLSRSQALNKGVYEDGPPVVYATASGTGFLLPSTGHDDPNARSSFEAPQGLQIVLSDEDERLRVVAEARPLRVEPGEKVNFSATVEGAGTGEQIEFSWYFDDGMRASGKIVSHRFAKPGRYKIFVTVTGAGNETGTSNIVMVQVGDPAKSGPDRKGGGTNKGENAPDHGAATGPATGTPGESGSASFPPPPVESFPPPTESFPEPEPEPLPQPEPQPAPEPEGEPVSGVLLEEGGTAAPEPETGSEEEPAAARTGTLSEKGGGDGGGLPDAAIGFVITGALLGAGGLIEARNLLR